ncbi:MAG: hypothetical protein LUQ07_06660 [Methanospirillum sp.]|nr:hypothetical protein [Methanospirillum sp.]
MSSQKLPEPASCKNCRSVVPPREDRLGSIIAAGGTAQDLVHQARCGCLKNQNRSFSQTAFCQQWLAIFTLATVRDAVVIVHGPVGCISSLPYINVFNRLGQIHRTDKPVSGRWISTNLLEADTIYGGEEKLKAAIRSAENRYHPAAIFVFSSCVSGIIGEDIGAIIDGIQPDIKATVIPINCDGFRSKLWASGYDGSFHGVLNYLIKEPGVKQADLVNVINPLTIGRPDEVEIERLLGRLNLRANFIPCFADVQAIKDSASAALTTGLCPTYGEYLAKVLGERYQVPSTQKVMPTGLDNISLWLREIGRYLGKEEEVERLIAEEHKRIQPKLDALRARLKGKTVFISAGQWRAIGIPNLVADLGLRIVGVTTFHFDEVCFDGFEELTRRCGDFHASVSNLQPFEQTSILHQQKPDIFIGHSGETVWAAKQGIPTVMGLNLFHVFVGYEGVIAFGNRLVDVLTNRSFNKNLFAHVKPIYNDEWYTTDPFKYIREEAE